MSEPQPWYPPPSARQKPDPRLILAILLLVVIVLIGVLGVSSLYNLSTSNVSNLGSSRSVNLVAGLITVPAGEEKDYQFIFGANANNIRIIGTFAVSGGGGNRMQVLVLDQANYGNWESHQQYSSFYDSGQATSGSIDNSLLSDRTYDLVYSNRLSTSNTTVQTRIDVYCSCLQH